MKLDFTRLHELQDKCNSKDVYFTLTMTPGCEDEWQIIIGSNAKIERTATRDRPLECVIDSAIKWVDGL